MIIIPCHNEREKSPLKGRALVGLGLGLEDNIIIHSVNNILILLSMINSVNVKNNRYVVCVSVFGFAICNLLLLLFFTLTHYITQVPGVLFALDYYIFYFIINRNDE